MQSKEFQAVCVAVKRGKEVVNLTVPEHEVRVLRAIYPADGHVKIVARPEGLTVDLDELAGKEWLRLVTLYNRTGQPDYVTRAFPLGVASLTEVGFTSSDAEIERPAASGTRVRAAKKAKPAEPKK